MNTDFEREIDSLHQQLAELYRGKSTDEVLKKQLWNRIELLEGQYRTEALTR